MHGALLATMRYRIRNKYNFLLYNISFVLKANLTCKIDIPLEIFDLIC